MLLFAVALVLWSVVFGLTAQYKSIIKHTSANNQVQGMTVDPVAVLHCAVLCCTTYSKIFMQIFPTDCAAPACSFPSTDRNIDADNINKCVAQTQAIFINSYDKSNHNIVLVEYGAVWIAGRWNVVR